MLAHNLKEILKIVPGVKEHIKQANIEEDFPLDNKDGCFASYINAFYLTKIANKPVEGGMLENLYKAATMYGIVGELKPFLTAMQKYAEQKQIDLVKTAESLPVKTAEAYFEGSLSGFFDVAKAMTDARVLMTKYAEQITSDTVKLYAGKAYFVKQAAVEALQSRASFSGNDTYNKVAALVEKSMDYDSTTDEVMNLCERVIELDKKAGLTARGYNFIKEALSTDSKRINSALIIKLAGKRFPYESFERLGKHRITQYLGKEVAAEMTHNPLLNKRIIETLPLDMQRVLAGLLRNV